MHTIHRLGDDAAAAAPALGSSYRSILIGIGSARGDSRTLAVAAALARRERARLTLLAAVTKPSPFTWMAQIPLPHDPVRAAEEECAARLRAALSRLPADLPVTTLLRREPASAALLAELDTETHDLVVVGGGRRGWTRGPTSRVARNVLRSSPVPVLVVNAARPSP